MTDQRPLNSASAPATSERNRDRLRDDLAATIDVIDRHSGILESNSSPVRHLKQFAHTVANDTNDMFQDAQLLRLGIVGQVNAGKSSLLNLLLFDGEEVLPKAVTPMTASLTHIVKSERDEVEIEYYTHEEWEEISHHARQYNALKSQQGRDIQEVEKEAAELVQMAEATAIDTQDHLGKRIVHAAPRAGLTDHLRHFVGADGDHTPLVKSVTIRSSQGVPDLDIVDTPGINDPIVSRARQADEMLRRCDAVLMLSSSSHFMSSPDVDFFERRIPQEGIQHRFVIGSKFDSVLIDASRDYSGPLRDAMDETARRLKHHAAEALARLNDATRQPHGEVVLTSAMCATLAKKPIVSWTKGEWQAFENLRTAYPDSLDRPNRGETLNTTTQQYLARIGNRAAVDARLRDLHTNKHRIIADKVAALLAHKQGQALKELDELLESLDERRTTVETRDLKDIENQRRSIDELEITLGDRVTDVWVKNVKGERQKGKLSKLTDDMRERFAAVTDAITNSSSEEVRRTGLFPLIARHLWGGGHNTREEAFRRQLVLESVISRALQKTEDDINDIVDEIFDIPSAKETANDIRDAVSDTFSNDLAAHIDWVSVRRALYEAVMQIFRQAESELRDATKSILTDQSFRYEAASRTEAPSTEAAREAALVFVRQAEDHANSWIECCREQIGTVLRRAQTDLVPATVKELKAYQKRVKKDMANRKRTLERYEVALRDLQDARQRFESVT